MRADTHHGQEHVSSIKGRIQLRKTNQLQTENPSCNARPVHTMGHNQTSNAGN